MTLPTARGQVVPAMRAPIHLSAFGTYTYGYSDWVPGAGIYGYSFGGFLQTGHLWGIEGRVSDLSWGALSGQASGLAGPRIAFHYRHFTPYGAALGGLGHARWQGPNGNYNRSGFAPEWSVLGGVDFRVSRRISLRLGEFSYSKIYVLAHGLTPTNYSAGIVFRLR